MMPNFCTNWCWLRGCSNTGNKNRVGCIYLSDCRKVVCENRKSLLPASTNDLGWFDYKCLLETKLDEWFISRFITFPGETTCIHWHDFNANSWLTIPHNIHNFSDHSWHRTRKRSTIKTNDREQRRQKWHNGQMTIIWLLFNLLLCYFEGWYPNRISTLPLWSWHMKNCFRYQFAFKFWIENK